MDALCDQFKQFVAQKEERITELTLQLSNASNEEAKELMSKCSSQEEMIAKSLEEVNQLLAKCQEQEKIILQLQGSNLTPSNDDVNKITAQCTEHAENISKLESKCSSYETTIASNEESIKELTAKCVIYEQTVTGLQENAKQLNAKCIVHEQTVTGLQENAKQLATSSEELKALTLKCQTQEQTIVQLQTQFVGVPELIAKNKAQEQTINEMMVHVKFTTWLQQAQAGAMQQLWPLYQQSLVTMGKA